MASSQDAWYLSLLGLAENFRTSNPPSIKLCIQCLQAVFNFKPPPRVEARTHLQLGNILMSHTKNVDLARTHLERAWQLSQSINGFDDVKFEAASVLADLYQQQQQIGLSQSILRKGTELSQHSVYWHCRLIFQLAVSTFLVVVVVVVIGKLGYNEFYKVSNHVFYTLSLVWVIHKAKYKLIFIKIKYCVYYQYSGIFKNNISSNRLYE